MTKFGVWTPWNTAASTQYRGIRMSVSLITRFWNLTSNEKLFLLMYPEHANAINDAAQHAAAETTRRFGRNDHNGQGDAFRHCLWSALLSRDIGYMHALRYTSADGDFPANPALEKAMDLHNNAVGLKLGLATSSNEIPSDRCINALRSGRLTVINK